MAKLFFSLRALYHFRHFFNYWRNICYIDHKFDLYLVLFFRIAVSALFNGLLYFVGRFPGDVFTNMYIFGVSDIIVYTVAYFGALR